MLSRVSKLYGCFFTVTILVLLAGCNSRHVDKSYTSGTRHVPKAVYGQTYTVKRGDTLYSIAWAIKKDFRTVAQWNGIRPPYTIHPGQRLRMYPPGKSTVSSSAERGTKKASGGSQSRKITYSAPPPSGRVKRWVWPTTSRRISSRFNPAAGKDGIDIAGRSGDGVYATADGQVVYAGSGLRGYGKLIILKHNKTYLSAYAHNENILVAEGQNIRAGHKIGKMGHDGGQAKLHFEIRKNGTPVDPVRYIK